MKRFSFWGLALLMALALSGAAACGGKKPTSAPAQPARPGQPAVAVQPAATDEPEAEQSATEAADVAATEAATPAEPAEEEEVAFSDVSELSMFDSYRLKHDWVWKYEGGEEETAEIVVEFVREPAAQRVVMKTSDADEKEGGMEMVQIGDTTYAKFGKEWMAMQSSSSDALKESGWFGSPEAFLGETRGKLVGRETINGMATKHYRYEQGGLAPMAQLSQVDKATADVWVSTEHNVYVQVVMHWEGVAEDKGPATFDLRSNLYDINKPITIEPPQGIDKPAVPEDVPLYDGAEDVAIMGTIITYKAAAAEADVTAFYQEAMPGQGWTAGDVTIPQMLQFTKGDRQVTVMISAEGEGTAVTIMSGKE